MSFRPLSGRRLLQVVGGLAVALLLVGCRGSTAPAANGPPLPATRSANPGLFTDVAAAAGVRFTHVSGATPEHLFAEITGSGCAFLDYDRDGWMDVILLSAGRLAQGAGSARNGLFRNVGGRFVDQTGGSGLEYTGYSQGAAVGDYDNDGFPDLYVTAFGGNHLFHNERGSGRFKDVTVTAGVGDLDRGRRYALSAAWGDFDRDGDLDLCVAHYAVWSPETDLPCLNTLHKRGYCNPEKYLGDHSRLYRNEGGGVFKDVSAQTGVGSVTGRGMGVAWLDYDGDGWQDLFITCDLTPNMLFHNTGRGGFKEVAVEANVAFGEMGTPLSGMGVAVGDYDNDGREDLHLTNFSHQPNSLFRNQGGGLFENASVFSGLAEPSNPLLGWGCEFLDYDLDGWKDLVVANGHIQEEIARLVPGLTHLQPKSLYRNSGDGTFSSVTGDLGDLAQPTLARGLAIGDFDNDGRPDVLVNNQAGGAQLFRNNGGSGAHSISFEFQGRRSNRDGLHTRITLQAGKMRQTRVARINSSFCSSNDPRVQFGLGENRAVDVAEIQWPSGLKARVKGLPADRLWRWIEGESSPRAVPAGSSEHERQSGGR